MAVLNPDAIEFQFFNAGGASQIALELPIENGDWFFIVQNDTYLWSFVCRRTFWSFGNFNSTLQRQEAVPADATIAEGFWEFADGRKDILVEHDLENTVLTVRLFDNADVNFATLSVTTVARAQGTLTFVAVASTAVEGYFTIETRPTSASPTLSQVFGLKLIEQRIALADL